MKNIASLATKIIAAQTYETVGRINSFHFADGKNNINDENFGQSVKEGQLGYYWGRRWMESGKDPVLLCAEFNALYFALKNVSYDKDKKRRCLTFQVGVIYPTKCCTNKFDAELSATNSLISFLKEFTGAMNYEINGVDQLLTPTQRQIAMMQIGVLLPLHKCANQMFFEWNGNVSADEYGANGHQMVYTDLKICECFKDNVVYDFSEKLVEEIGLTKCETC